MRHRLPIVVFAASLSTTTGLAPAIANAASLGHRTSPGLEVLGDIDAARNAIGDGEPELAATLIRDGLVTLDRAGGQAGFVARIDAPPGDWIEITSQVLVAHAHGNAPGRAPDITSAVVQDNGDGSSTARRVLRTDAFDIGFVRVLLPVIETKDRLDMALRKLNDTRYADANTELREAEKGLNIDTVMLYDDTTKGNER